MSGFINLLEAACGRAMGLLLKVECYGGYKADERPLRFTFVSSSVAPDHSSRPDPRVYEVAEVLDRWYGPGYECFKVRAHDQNLHVLRHHLGQDNWTLESFRRDGLIED